MYGALVSFFTLWPLAFQLNAEIFLANGIMNEWNLSEKSAGAGHWAVSLHRGCVLVLLIIQIQHNLKGTSENMFEAYMIVVFIKQSKYTLD